MARFIGAKAKDCLQVPSISSMTRWFSSISLWRKSSLWGYKPAPIPIRPRGPGPRYAEFLCLISPSECLWTRLCLGCDWHCTWTLVTARPPWLLPERESIEMNKRTHHRFLLSFAYTVFSWVWEGVSLFSI